MFAKHSQNLKLAEFFFLYYKIYRIKSNGKVALFFFFYY